jgi:hypothetical protein
MVVFVFRAKKAIDVEKLQQALAAMGIKTKALEASEGGSVRVTEGKKKVYDVSKGMVEIGDSEIIALDPDVRVDDFPENMLFGDGVTQVGDFVWFVVDAKYKDVVKAKASDIIKMGGG